MQTQLRSDGIISAKTQQAASVLHDRFAIATPFKHVIVDDFFTEQFARELVAQFPSFDKRKAINEMGRVGGKSAQPLLSELGAAYRAAHEHFGSPEFLAWLSDLTGIPDLRYDPENFGGGTHENLDGQELLPHVDFNYHPKTHYHRRLNMIVYLNEGWQKEWGGSITVHLNPRDSINDQTKAYPPSFNRCIIFETNERSWHSFDKIALPADQKQNSRKSLSIYFYTVERPEDETYSKHTTFYVPRPLPQQFRPGLVLSQADVDELHGLLFARDELIKLHQLREAEREPATAAAQRYLQQLTQIQSRIRLPIMGFVKQIGKSDGFYSDGWIGGHAQFSIEAVRAVKSATIVGRLPERLPQNSNVAVEFNGELVGEFSAAPGAVELRFPVALKPREHGTLKIKCDTINYKRLGISDDIRDLGLFIDSIIFDA